jgi:hypothetical protein
MLPKEILIEVFAYVGQWKKISLVCKAWLDTCLRTIAQHPLQVRLNMDQLDGRKPYLRRYESLTRFKYGIFSLNLHYTLIKKDSYYSIYNGASSELREVMSKVRMLLINVNESDYSCFKNLTHLSIKKSIPNKVICLPKTLTSLRAVGLYGCTLSPLPNLQSIDVYGATLDYSLFPQLTRLKVQDAETIDFNEMPNLTDLDIEDSDVVGFETLTKLKRLHINTHDIHLSHLTSLIAFKFPEDYSVLSMPDVNNITRLDVSCCKNIDVSLFHNVTHLSMLYACNIKGIDNLKKLEVVKITLGTDIGLVRAKTIIICSSDDRKPLTKIINVDGGSLIISKKKK